MAKNSQLALFLLFVAYAACDLYMHNPRGSNDRLNEANTNRNNANRLFDSQNNAKGGYCVGPQMTFYEGSLLTVEWTAQHGCGANPKMICNMVLQYMCGAESTGDGLTQIRDGETTDTIPDDADAAATEGQDVPYKYGMHENYQYYQDCKVRDRNMGLYIADREEEGGLNAGRAAARFTRQNNNGNRHGFECAEERDYYPYWHPSPWRDIAILAHSTEYCDFYKSESQNVKAKGYCQDANTPTAQAKPNNPAACQSAGNTWTEDPAFGIPEPDCIQVPWSRENHLGNGAVGAMTSYNMTFPKVSELKKIVAGDWERLVCVLRLRYNISTVEDLFPDMSRPDAGFVDWTHNAGSSVNFQDPELNFTDPTTEQLSEIQLAIDTSQFGRTFQDRSHTFFIAPRPDRVSKTARVYNLNVRGKRGNIVQAYPATEYDFVPQFLFARVGDYIHFQWTGCDTNPAGNAGEGTDQTDRSNMVQVYSADNSKPVTEEWCKKNPKKVLFQDAKLRYRMMYLDQTGCLTQSELEAEGQNDGQAQADERNCGKLNNGSRYFDGGVYKMNLTGTFNYMSTRNHNFSNRDQKGVIVIQSLLPSWAVGVVIAGAVLFVAASATAGLMFYAKSHPHSGVANLFSKM